MNERVNKSIRLRFFDFVPKIELDFFWSESQENLVLRIACKEKPIKTTFRALCPLKGRTYLNLRMKLAGLFNDG